MSCLLVRALQWGVAVSSVTVYEYVNDEEQASCLSARPHHPAPSLTYLHPV